MAGVAIIGSGVSGLTAAYALSQQGTVTLFERDDRFGGHAHTHDVADASGRTQHVDSGFIVHNDRTYPTLLRLFAELGIATQPTEMSMSIRCDGCGLEYAGGRGAAAILAQPRRLADPRFVRMLTEVPRFHRAARRLLDDPTLGDPDWGTFLDDAGFSDYFVRHFAIPLVSCVWSSGDADTRRYPARHLFAFLANHGMLSVSGSPLWRTVTGGSGTYVRAVVARLDAARVATPVVAVRRHADGVEVTTADGTTSQFDAAVIATHADDALRILADATDEERRDLAAFGYSTNTTWLHRDASVLPRSTRARASWNYRIDSCRAEVPRVHVSYWMNRLQALDAQEDYLVTLNPGDAVAPDRVIASMEYTHPVFTRDAVAAAPRLRATGGPRLAFAGAHLGWGFHEDGARSGLEAARRLGATW